MEKYIGIVMNRKLLDYGIYLFKPECLIEGTIEYDEDDYCIFTDTNGLEYLTMSEGETTTIDEETVVGYTIKEENLLKKFHTRNLKEAKNAYYEYICEQAHIGFYVADKELIAVTQLDLRTMADKVNGAEMEGNIIKIDMDSDHSEIEEVEYVSIEKSEYEKIMNIDNLEELKEKLNNIYNQVMQYEQEIDGEYIRNLFNNSYDSLFELEDINEMKYILKTLEDFFTEKIVELDEKEKEGYIVEEAQDYLYTYAQIYHDLQLKTELSEIKFELQKIKNLEEPKINDLMLKYDNSQQSDLQEEKEIKEINVREIKKFFDKKIIGQEEAKKDVIQAIYMNELSDDSRDKNSCLLVGPTGSGKTLIAETVSEYFNKPLEIIDTTQLTVPGYVGANIEDFLSRLIGKANGNLEKAENGIVVFDELDKKGSSQNSDISGKGVLNTLLPFLQGTTYDVKYNNKTYQFNTSKLTIFATGAFTDVAKNKATNSSSNCYKNNKIGFNSTINNKNTEEDIKYEKLEIEDFVKYGEMPIELIGRFSTIAQLTGHTKESLKSILTDSDISTLLAEKNKLKKINIDLTWTEGYIDAVVNKALELKTGARSLKNTVEKSIKEARWEVLNNLELYSAIILTEKTVENNNNFELLDKEGNSINLIEEKIKIKKLKKGVD